MNLDELTSFLQKEADVALEILSKYEAKKDYEINKLCFVMHWAGLLDLFRNLREKFKNNPENLKILESALFEVIENKNPIMFDVEHKTTN